ncbi:MAG: hypothetical protein KAI79_04485 [Bacteroidales bacterium]|nr:hypothetical protein [Bacteroidales bacterium]
MLEILNNIRLAALIKETKKKKNPEVNYQLEEMEPEEKEIAEAFELEKIHINRPKISGVSIYNSRQRKR